MRIAFKKWLLKDRRLQEFPYDEFINAQRRKLSFLFNIAGGSPQEPGYLLLENGFNLLTEAGGKFLLEGAP